jgi:circadian clock protein KaiC
VNRPSAAQLEKARLLLLHEGAAGSAGECATAAGGVYDKLHAHLDPLLGAAGVQALLVRSAKLTQRQFSFLEVAVVEDSAFLVGEYADGERDSAVLTVADGLLWLYQAIDRNSVVRKLHVMKMRGQGQIPGLHTARVSDSGVSVFPRLLKPAEIIAEHPLKHRLSTGVQGLDEMLGGGIPRGYSVLLAGPSGSGKTVLSNQFIIDGAEHGEKGVVAIFEKRPNDYLQTTPRGNEFEKLVREKKLEVVSLRPLDLSIDETLLELQDAVKRLGAKRAVIDSLSGLELALAPTFREDFRESLYRMMGISSEGRIVVGRPLTGYEGILTGTPRGAEGQ